MKTYRLTRSQARQIWLHAQRLDERTPFGTGPGATRAAIEHLGYVQIDTINVIERAHHHILFSRIPEYRRGDLATAQSVDKSVFEYWTHALAYVPVRDLAYYLADMRQQRSAPMRWYADADPADLRKLLRQIRREGPVSIRDIDDEELIEKDHPWASRKPSKRVLQYGFYSGELAISERTGMVKTYELMSRHFGWQRAPRPATERQVDAYLLDRALTAQGLVSAPSVMYPRLRFSAGIAALVERRLRSCKLVPVRVEDDPALHYVRPSDLERRGGDAPSLVHILSPFDPLIIQRRRTSALFGYDHVFEAYVPKARRRFGYFTLPVLVGEDIVAALDLKTDRAANRVLIQAWHWVGRGDAAAHRPLIEAELDRFSAFQLGT